MFLIHTCVEHWFLISSTVLIICVLLTDNSVKAILVNVFGGIVNCATIANGIVNACRNMKLNIPLVVRLEGMNHWTGILNFCMTILYFFIRKSSILIVLNIYYPTKWNDIQCLMFAGTNVKQAKDILSQSGLPIRAASNLDDAALKAVSSLNSS